MKNKNIKGKSIITFISFSIILLSAVIFNSGCKKIRPERLAESNSIGEANSFVHVPPVPELVVWLKPGKTRAQFYRWRDSVKIAGGGDVIITKGCKSCDSSLMLLTGPGITTYISSNTASGGLAASKTTPATGEDGPLYFSRNFPIVNINFQNPADSTVRPLPRATFYTKGTVKVAVFDTGIDTFGLNHYPFISDPSLCFGSLATRGWNMITNTVEFMDDNAIWHGSTVTRFITQQAVKYGRNKVQILPVKTHDRYGQANLFTILCAFAYAKDRKVDIINASFGFYVPRLEKYIKKYPADPNVSLLKAFITEILTKNKILLVAAAGNQDDVNERRTFDEHRLQLPDLPYPTDWRNLDQVSFYPASLARDAAFPNVIAVTTVDTLTGTPSPVQNYSSSVVDLGVQADRLNPQHYYFDNPRSLRANATVEGSSFAAPIVTGKLCAYFDLVKSVIASPKYTKKDIWNALGSALVKIEPDLDPEIRNGRYMIKY